MNRLTKRSAVTIPAIVVVLLALAGGIAYATIPDGGGVYTACRLNDRNEQVDAAQTTDVGGSVDLHGGHVSINGGSSCQPLARIGDQVTASGVISTGSATVCAG